MSGVHDANDPAPHAWDGWPYWHRPKGPPAGALGYATVRRRFVAPGGSAHLHQPAGNDMTAILEVHGLWTRDPAAPGGWLVEAMPGGPVLPYSYDDGRLVVQVVAQ